MDKERWVPAEKESGFTTCGWTEFGKHVGQDEINWWIVENKTNLDEVSAITDEALNAAQVLKTDAAKLKNREPESYEVLLVDLRKFAEQHRVEIDTLHKYVGCSKNVIRWHRASSSPTVCGVLPEWPTGK
ncbi:MAG: hypothetical protein ABSE28_23410 [Candidatus Sulfotelmatobacter sp.]|jgi:hypothetical protein